MRAQMDATLLRYIAAAERKELLLDKMNNPGQTKREEKDRGEDDDEDKRSKDRGERGEKKRSSSRKSAG